MTRNSALLGSAEVRATIGRWQEIVGGTSYGPKFIDVLGSETNYNPYPGGYRPPPPQYPRHHHHRGYAPPAPPAWSRAPAGYGGGYGYGPANLPVVRIHGAGIAHRAIVQGDPIALGALELMGAEAAQQAVADATANPAMAADAAAASESAVPSQGGGGPESYPEANYGIPPRNALVERPGPTRADRVLLPMSSGVAILPNTSAQITSRPQNVAFRPERVIIGGTPGDWIVNDIKVGNRSQFSQSGDVPGETFASTTIDSFVSFETVQTAMDFVMLVTYIGASEAGAAFYCAVLGTAAI